MRQMLFIIMALVALSGCQPGGRDGAGAPSPIIAGAPIDVTPLDGPAAGRTAKTAPENGVPDPLAPAMVDAAETADVAVPDAAPPEAKTPTAAPADAVPPVTAPPAELKSRDQVRCEKGGGRWEKIGKSPARSCVRATRDGGKACTGEDDCQGQCLARSGTCAPYDPLFGCNEVLQQDGNRVTLCLD